MRQSMTAVVLRGPRDLEVMTVPVPHPRPGEALLEVTACGICGSDLRYYEGENPWAKHTVGHETPNPPNMILGHEVAGRHEGRAVAALAFKSCGRCLACRRGQENLCADTAHLGHGAGWGDVEFYPGGMAELCPVWQEHLYALPPGVSAAEGTFLDGLAVAVHAVRRAALLPGASLLVLGAGPIGLCIMQAARAMGAGPSWVADVYDVALECAAGLGADETRQVDGGGMTDLAEELAPGPGKRGMDAVFESTGDPQAQEAALRMLAPGGCMVLMAGAAPGLRLPDGAVAGERRLTTASNHMYEDFQIALELLASGRVRVGPMITHTFPLAEALRAFDVARDKPRHGAIKVIIEP